MHMIELRKTPTLVEFYTENSLITRFNCNFKIHYGYNEISRKYSRDIEDNLNNEISLKMERIQFGTNWYSILTKSLKRYIYTYTYMCVCVCVCDV